jgi:hypothetical protein
MGARRPPAFIAAVIYSILNIMKRNALSRTMVGTTSTVAVLAALLLPQASSSAVAMDLPGRGTPAVSLASARSALTIDVPPLPVGKPSDWIQVRTPTKFQGVLTVEAPTGTRIIAADADIRPYAGQIAADGKTVVWAGATTTWEPGWRVAKFRLVPDADLPLGPRPGGRAGITNAAGVELTSGEFAVQAVAGLTAPSPSTPLGATTDWVRVLPSQAVEGALTVTAPSGMKIVAADADLSATPGEIAADGASAHWSDPTTRWSEEERIPKVKLRAETSAAGVRTPGSLRVETAAGEPAAVGSYSFIPRGAIPASVITAPDGAYTDVRVYGIGSAAVEQARENRSMRHSDLQPTGRFVRVGDVIEVTMPAEAPATGVRIGLYGDSHQGVSTSGWQALTSTPSGTTTRITAVKDGMVFLESTAPSGSAVARIAGGQPVPTFVLGQTTDEDFAAQVEAMPDAPLFEVVGNRIFGDFQTRVLDAVPTKLAERVQLWDDVVELTNDMHDLHDDATGAARKSPHRMYIASADTSGGYANASQERIMFPVSTGAARDLFRSPADDMWGFWHEVGHTYQTPSYNWSDQGEVAVNVSALYIQSRMGIPSRVGKPGDVDALRKYFGQPIDERTYQSAGGWLRLVMYDQLRRAFGNEFYPQLNQELRTAKALGELSATTTTELQNLFAVTSARVADRDLTEFFRQWGIPLTEQSRSEMTTRPALTVPIWENIDPADSRVDHELPRIGVPNGTVHTEETVVVGQRTLQNAPDARGVTSPDGGTVTAGKHAVSALDPGTSAGRVTVEARDARGLREALSTTVDVSAGNSIKILGQRDRTVMWLSLVPGDRELRVVPRTTYKAHDSWSGREYIGLELRSADDQESLGSWSIRGDETAYALGDRFDEHYQDGQILTVRHQQSDGIFPYTDGQPVAMSTDREQRFRIEGDRLVRLGPVSAVPGAHVDLERGATTDVEAGIAFRQDTAGATGTATFTAPTGATFASSIGSELLGSYRPEGGTWSDSTPYAKLSAVTRSADGTELTATFRFIQDSSRGYDSGDELRWRLPVTVPDDAPAGTSQMGFAFRGATQ